MSIKITAFRHPIDRLVVPLYTEERLSTDQIAKKTGQSRALVSRRLVRCGVRLRSNAQSQTAINATRAVEFNETQVQLIYGSLLGDACLNVNRYRSNKTGKSLTALRLSFAHCEKQRAYLDHKHALLGLGVKTRRPTRIFQRTSGHGSRMFAFCFTHAPSLAGVAKLCLDRNGKKCVTRRWLEKLTWEGLAYWYQDDGTLIRVRDGVYRVGIATQGFRFKQQVLLREFLANLGISASIITATETQYCLAIHRKADARRFLAGVAPFIHPSMQYKLPPDLRKVKIDVET